MLREKRESPKKTKAEQMGASGRRHLEEENDRLDDEAKQIDQVKQIVWGLYGGDGKKTLRALKNPKNNNINDLYKKVDSDDEDEITMSKEVAVDYLKRKIDRENCKHCARRRDLLEQYEWGYEEHWEKDDLYPGTAECSQCQNDYQPSGPPLQELKVYFTTRMGDSTARHHYCYLLLDAAVLRSAKKLEEWSQFIFYVGKGKDGRYLDHLAEAKKDGSSDKCVKIRQLLDRNGLIIIQFGLQSKHYEALSCEECVMLYLKGEGISLTNVNPSSCHGVAKLWDDKRRIECGRELLEDAFKFFERQDHFVYKSHGEYWSGCARNDQYDNELLDHHTA